MAIMDVSSAITNITMRRATSCVNAARIQVTRAIITAGRSIAIHITTVGIMAVIAVGMGMATVINQRDSKRMMEAEGPPPMLFLYKANLAGMTNLQALMTN